MMSYCTKLPVFSFLDIDGGKTRGIFCDSNCIFTFSVLIYRFFNVFSVRNYIQDFFVVGNVFIWEGGCYSEQLNHISETKESRQIKTRTV